MSSAVNDMAIYSDKNHLLLDCLYDSDRFIFIGLKFLDNSIFIRIFRINGRTKL